MHAPLSARDDPLETETHLTFVAERLRRHLGIPPHAYVLGRRIDAARWYLLEGRPPGAVAAEVGCYDQAHLTRHFKRHVGTTPGLRPRRPLTPLAIVAAPTNGATVDADAPAGDAAALPNLLSSSAFVAAAAFVPDELSGTRVTGAVDLGPQHHTPWGVVHGGVYTTAIESAASIGASLAVRDRGMFAVGLSNSTDFIRPMREGRVDVVAEPLMQGRTQQVWVVDIVRNNDGKRIAHGKVRLQNVALA